MLSSNAFANGTRAVRRAFTSTLAAAGTGLLLTWWSLDTLLTLVPDGLPRIESVRIDPTVVLFTGAVALATSMLAAWRRRCGRCASTWFRP